MTDMIEISNAMLERRIAQARHEGYDAALRDMRSLSALDVSAVKDFPWMTLSLLPSQDSKEGA